MSPFVSMLLGVPLFTLGFWWWMRSIPTPGESHRVSWETRKSRELGEGGIRFVMVALGAGATLIAHAIIETLG